MSFYNVRTNAPASAEKKCCIEREMHVLSSLGTKSKRLFYRENTSRLQQNVQNFLLLHKEHTNSRKLMINLVLINLLAPNDVYIYIYMSYRTANLPTLHFKYLLKNILTEYFKHAAHSPLFSLQDAVYFIMLSFVVPVIFTF